MTSLASALSAILPRDIAFDIGSVKDRQGPLLDDEWAVVEESVDRRRSEFRAGRTCARRALGLLAGKNRPILPDADGCPVWPDGWIGSISHTSDFCAAVVARRERYLGVGLDIEAAGPLSETTREWVCRPEEMRRAPAADPHLPPSLSYDKLLFVIKEAAYKAMFSCLRRSVHFLDFDVSLEPETTQFDIRITDAGGAEPVEPCAIRGDWAYTVGHCLAFAAIRVE